jgi:hypothetical protein
MSQLRPLNQLIEYIPNIKNGKEVDYLNDTINLEESIELENQEETVRLYYFAKTIKATYEEILQAFSEPEGRGFWITAEYGVGKSHFLATLACLLVQPSEKIWRNIHDEDIRNYLFRFKDQKLFPIIDGLRGKSAISADKPITLLNQLEKAIENSIEKLNLSNLINITPVQETIEFYDGCVPELKRAIDDHIRYKTNKMAEIVKQEDLTVFAELVKGFFRQSKIQFGPSYNIEDRLRYLYNQIVNSRTGFTGLLIILDEYEAWQQQRPITKSEGIFDSNVLQVLTELLPSRHNCNIYTIVASQSEIPTQLYGSKRFTYRTLLAGEGAERDYHVISAYRVRRYKQGGESEAELYFHNLYEEFESYKNENKEQFIETFPFHPLSYEFVRRFTSNVGDEPGLRLGINIFYDLVRDNNVLSNTSPIISAHLPKHSPNFKRALEKPRLIDGYQKYLDAVKAVPRVFKEQSDQILAQNIITTLYLHYVVYQGQTLALTTNQIADATLTGTNGITGSERVFVILQQMVGQISQIVFDPSQPDRGARFVPKKTGPTPRELLDELKNDPSITGKVIEQWAKILFQPPTMTMGIQSMFAGLSVDKPTTEKCIVNQIEYEGEYIVTHSWRSELGQKFGTPFKHFRIVYLLNPSEIPVEEIEDPRIVVLKPVQLSADIIDKVKELLAAEKLKSDYAPGRQSGVDASEIRAYAENQYNNMLSEIINNQIKIFLNGQAITRDGLNIDLQVACIKPTSEQRHNELVRPLLVNAYKEIRNIFNIDRIERPVVLADAKNLIIGFLQNDQSKAVRSTLDQKAVGLGLSLDNDPRTLSPDHCELFEIISKRLEEKNGAIILSTLIKDLTGPPFGIPTHILAAQLLLFVRYRSQPSPVEIELNPIHKISTIKGDRLASNRITRSNVKEIVWQNGIEEYFNTLFEVKGPDWNTLVPYAQIFLEEAKSAVQPNEIDRQTDSFLAHLKEEYTSLTSAISGLRALERTLEQNISEADDQAFSDTIDLLKSEDLESFSDKLKDMTEDVTALKYIFDRAQKLKHLSQHAAELIQQYEVIRKLDLGNHVDLAADRDILLARFSIQSLTTSSNASKSLLTECEKYLQKIDSVRKVHVKRMNEELQELIKKLRSAESFVKSLELLNKLEMLGLPAGQDLPDRIRNLIHLVTNELDRISMRHEELSYFPPSKEIDSVINETKLLLEKRLAILRSELERVVQSENVSDELTKLIKLIQVGSIEEFGRKLTPSLTDAIRKVLEKSNTITMEGRVFDQLSQKFPTVGIDDIDNVVSEFRKLLLSVLGDGNKSGKKIKITLR